MAVCFVALGWVVSSCGSDTLVPTGRCTSVGPLAVLITVRDSISGQAAANGAIGTLVGSGVDDTLITVDSLTILGGDQLGTYTVTIDRPGYLTWSMSDVHVTQKGDCGNVIPVKLNAKLQPAIP
jgi:hypothetical protein